MNIKQDFSFLEILSKDHLQRLFNISAHSWNCHKSILKLFQQFFYFSKIVQQFVNTFEWYYMMILQVSERFIENKDEIHQHSNEDCKLFNNVEIVSRKWKTFRMIPAKIFNDDKVGFFTKCFADIYSNFEKTRKICCEEPQHVYVLKNVWRINANVKKALCQVYMSAEPFSCNVLSVIDFMNEKFSWPQKFFSIDHHFIIFLENHFL